MSQFKGLTKVIQRRLYSFLNTWWGFTVFLILCYLLLTSIITIITTETCGDEQSLKCSAKHHHENIAFRDVQTEISYGPIDVVYTWVNGSDPVWAKKKEQYAVYHVKDPEAATSPTSLQVGNSSVSSHAATMMINETSIESNDRRYNTSSSVIPTITMHQNSSMLASIASNSSLSSVSSHQNTTAFMGVNNTTVSSNGGGGGEEEVEEDDTMSLNRYRDSNELRYSLRSLVKNAPWIRHIYIVTDNQVPNWLNLETGRLSVVSHEQIFPNTSHLPVFSSPAIESHLHRIPGLSQKFIYFNDDVFLGAPVTPEDFVSLGGTQKLVMAWDVPKCAPGCSDSWIGDGFCDKACNVSACNFDFPDCVNATSYGAGSPGARGGSSSHKSRHNLAYCAKGCPDGWLADKVCDQRCKNEECAFDVADCGMDLVAEHYHGVEITAANSVLFHLSPGDPEPELEPVLNGATDSNEMMAGSGTEAGAGAGEFDSYDIDGGHSFSYGYGAGHGYGFGSHSFGSYGEYGAGTGFGVGGDDDMGMMERRGSWADRQQEGALGDGLEESMGEGVEEGNEVGSEPGSYNDPVGYEDFRLSGEDDFIGRDYNYRDWGASDSGDTAFNNYVDRDQNPSFDINIEKQRKEEGNGVPEVEEGELNGAETNPQGVALDSSTTSSNTTAINTTEPSLSNVASFEATRLPDSVRSDAKRPIDTVNGKSTRKRFQNNGTMHSLVHRGADMDISNSSSWSSNKSNSSGPPAFRLKNETDDGKVIALAVPYGSFAAYFDLAPLLCELMLDDVSNQGETNTSDGHGIEAKTACNISALLHSADYSFESAEHNDEDFKLIHSATLVKKQKALIVLLFHGQSGAPDPPPLPFDVRFVVSLVNVLTERRLKAMFMLRVVDASVAAAKVARFTPAVATGMGLVEHTMLHSCQSVNVSRNSSNLLDIAHKSEDGDADDRLSHTPYIYTPLLSLETASVLPYPYSDQSSNSVKEGAVFDMMVSIDSARLAFPGASERAIPGAFKPRATMAAADQTQHLIVEYTLTLLNETRLVYTLPLRNAVLRFDQNARVFFRSHPDKVSNSAGGSRGKDGGDFNNSNSPGLAELFQSADAEWSKYNALVSQASIRPIQRFQTAPHSESGEEESKLEQQGEGRKRDFYHLLLLVPMPVAWAASRGEWVHCMVRIFSAAVINSDVANTTLSLAGSAASAVRGSSRASDVVDMATWHAADASELTDVAPYRRVQFYRCRSQPPGQQDEQGGVQETQVYALQQDQPGGQGDALQVLCLSSAIKWGSEAAVSVGDARVGSGLRGEVVSDGAAQSRGNGSVVFGVPSIYNTTKLHTVVLDRTFNSSSITDDSSHRSGGDGISNATLSSSFDNLTHNDTARRRLHSTSGLDKSKSGVRGISRVTLTIGDGRRSAQISPPSSDTRDHVLSVLTTLVNLVQTIGTVARSFHVQVQLQSLLAWRAVSVRVIQLLAQTSLVSLEPNEGDQEEDSTSGMRRRLVDTYAASLIRVNRMYNKAFGNENRKVPAHVPHMIDRQVITELQELWPAEWDQTSANRFRSTTDMQYSFSYYHYLVHRYKKHPPDLHALAARAVDSDNDGMVNNNELRTLAAMVKGTSSPTAEDIQSIRDCISANSTFGGLHYSEEVRHHTSTGSVHKSFRVERFPTVSEALNCTAVVDGLTKNTDWNLLRPTHTFLSDKDLVAFEMVSDEFNGTLAQLDSVRARQSKFICINDNMRNPSAELAAALQDFFESFFPTPSVFELPPGQLNPSLYLDEYRAIIAARSSSPLHSVSSVASIVMSGELLGTVARYIGSFQAVQIVGQFLKNVAVESAHFVLDALQGTGDQYLRAPTEVYINGLRREIHRSPNNYKPIFSVEQQGQQERQQQRQRRHNDRSDVGARPDLWILFLTALGVTGIVLLRVNLRQGNSGSFGESSLTDTVADEQSVVNDFPLQRQQQQQLQAGATPKRKRSKKRGAQLTTGSGIERDSLHND